MNRTGGMTAIAVCNLIFGTLFLLPALFWLIGGARILFGAVSLGGDQVEESMVLFYGSLVVLPLAVCLIASGVGILRMLPWGRTYSLVFAWPMFAVSFLRCFYLADRGALYTALIQFFIFGSYPIILLILFTGKSWRHAFAIKPNA